MSLPRDCLHPVPVETARVAHAAFPDGNVYVRLRDELGTLFDNELFTAVYAIEGQPALHHWQLALVSVMQFMENLSDRQAAQAVRARIDWKYVLGLELTDEGFHYSMLSEFRTRLVQGSLEQVLLDTLLKRCQERGWLKARGRQRTDSTYILGAVKALNQLELVGETPGMRSTCWRPWRRSGSSRRSSPSGLSGMLSASKTIGCPKTRPNATR